MSKTETFVLDWHSFATVKRWKKRLEMKNEEKEIPKKTLETMGTWFPPFLRFHNKTPDELIEEAIADDEKCQDRLDDFWRYKKTLIDRNSCITGIYGTLRGFYRHNKVNVQNIIAPSFSVRQIKKTDSNYPLFKVIQLDKGGKKIKKAVLNRELLREFYSHLSNTYQCFLLVQMSTGLDSSDILKLTVGDVRAQMDLDRIHFSGNRNKTSVEFSDFASKEATSRIKKIVKNERINAENDEFVFVISNETRKRNFTELHKRRWTRDDLLPPATKLSADNVSKAYRISQKAMGIPLEKGKQGPLRPKRFRKVFRTACSHAGLDRDITKIFLGHSVGRDQSQTYEEDGIELMEYYYEMVEPKISLFYDEEADSIDKNEIKIQLMDSQKQLEEEKQARIKFEVEMKQTLAKLRDEKLENFNKN